MYGTVYRTVHTVVYSTVHTVVYSAVYSIVFSTLYTILLETISRKQGREVPQGISQLTLLLLSLVSVYCKLQCTPYSTVYVCGGIQVLSGM